MKSKLLLIAIIFTLINCKSNQIASKKDLYEILFQCNYGGECFNFYEIITTEKDFRKVLSEETLIGKVKKDDINTHNFLFLSLGEKNTGGYGISVSNVEEQSDKIIVTIKKTEPSPNSPVTTAITYPFCVVKINSKISIEIKD